MKLAFYSPAWPPENVSNGIVTYLSHVIPALRECGHEVFVITSDARTSDPHLIDLNEYKKSPSLWQRLLFKISKRRAIFKYSTVPLVAAIKHLVSKRGLQLLEIEESFGFSEEISKLKLIPVVVRLHGPWFLNKRHEDVARERQEAKAIGSASFITSPTNAVMSATIKQLAIPESRVTKIMNPITVTDLKWSLDHCAPKTLLFIGRFDAIKGADLVILAFKLLADSDPELRLSIVGPDHGVDFNGETVGISKFIKRTLNAEVASRVTYLGEVAHDKLDDLRRHHFITISASRFEVFGYTVAEAMSLGCPVVASDAGGIPELIKTENNGLLFEAGNATSLAHQCQRFLDRPTFASKCGATAATFCRDELNPGKIVEQSISIYKKVTMEFN